jgi:hypothetical protein
LPLALYFFGFKKRVSWLVLCAFVFWGLLLSNWMIPNEADAFLTYFNHSVILLEAGIILFENHPVCCNHKEVASAAKKL